MKKLTFSRKNDLGQLLGEIEAAVPALRPRVVEGERQAVMCVGGEGEQIVVLVPDETGEADVAAVAVAVASHVPKAKRRPTCGRSGTLTRRTCRRRRPPRRSRPRSSTTSARSCAPSRAATGAT